MTLANRITLSRLPLLILTLLLLYRGDSRLKLLAFVLTIVLIAMDWVDGWAARRRGEATPLGSVLDIAVDRIVEVAYWIAYADLDLIPVWVPILVAARGILTDALRAAVMVQMGETAFGMMKSRLGQLIVSGRFMRAFYGFAKAASFAGLALYLSLLDRYSLPFPPWLGTLHRVLLALVFFTVAITVIRALPVLNESRHYLTPKPARNTP